MSILKIARSGLMINSHFEPFIPQCDPYASSTVLNPSNSDLLGTDSNVNTTTEITALWESLINLVKTPAPSTILDSSTTRLLDSYE